ncbi:MAG: 3-phosphoshikimate 1-carboxyvinyltransferase, partial [Planctomycetales bacterium]|nr:3-phosphoshikimate 1-carboxyvinyltransferase [Planctomycetales bacterium]
MPDKIEIAPLDRPFNAVAVPPGSKSVTNRALVCAALAEGTSTLTGALDSEDTQVMISALRRLGVPLESADEGRTLKVSGGGGKFPTRRCSMFVGNSGTTMRFLTAMCAVGEGRYRLDGVARMRQRPIGDLVDALNQLGADVACEGDGRCPPVVVNARGLKGGTTRMAGDVSSQFLSGLLMAAP